MRIALLACDHMDKKYIPEHGTYDEIFSKFFNQLDLTVYRVCDGYLPMPTEYDGFICTGSRYSVYDDIPWIIQLKSLVQRIYETEKPFLGICFGHQMMAHALGGVVERSEGGFLIGVHEFNVIQKEAWMRPPVDIYKVLMLCQDQVMKLPGRAEVLSESPACPVGMFKIGDQMLGIQGHPEFTKAFNQAIFESRADWIKKDVITKAIQSFTSDPDRELIQTYLHNFFLDRNSV